MERLFQDRPTGYRQDVSGGRDTLVEKRFEGRLRYFILDQRNSVMMIVSGGQTGADRGAMEAAMDCGVSHFGFCPKGRLAEDGTIPATYNVYELKTKSYPERTNRNVEYADATLVFYSEEIEGGTALTIKSAQKYNRPYCIVNVSHPDYLSQIDGVREWMNGKNILVLNVAGPRESKVPGMQEKVREFMTRLIHLWKDAWLAS